MKQCKACGHKGEPKRIRTYTKDEDVEFVDKCLLCGSIESMEENNEEANT